MTTLQTSNGNLFHWHGIVPSRHEQIAAGSTVLSGDGLWTSFAIHPPHWPALRRVGRSGCSGPTRSPGREWSDPVYVGAHRGEIVAGIARLAATTPRAELIAEGQARGLLVLPVNEVCDVAADRHLRGARLLRRREGRRRGGGARWPARRSGRAEARGCAVPAPAPRRRRRCRGRGRGAAAAGRRRGTCAGRSAPTPASRWPACASSTSRGPSPGRWPPACCRTSAPTSSRSSRRTGSTRSATSGPSRPTSSRSTPTASSTTAAPASGRSRSTSTRSRARS